MLDFRGQVAGGKGACSWVVCGWCRDKCVIPVMDAGAKFSEVEGDFVG